MDGGQTSEDGTGVEQTPTIRPEELERGVAEQQRRLMERLLTYREISERCMDAVSIVDASGHYIEQNQASRDLLGYPDEEFIGRSPDFIFGDGLNSEIVAALARMGTYQGERVCTTRDGSAIEVRLSVSAVLDEAGKLLCYVGIERDITQSKRAERALRESEANYHAIFDSVNDAIIVFDLDTLSVLDFNKKALELRGRTPEEFGRLTLGDLCGGGGPYGPESAMRIVRKVVEEGPQLFEWLSTDEYGEPLWLEVNVKQASVRGQERILAVVRNFTERKETEQALASEKERLAVTLRSISDGVIATDTSGHVILLNRMAERLTGCWEEEAYDKLLDGVFQLFDERDLTWIRNPVEDVLTAGQPIDVPRAGILVDREGTRRNIALSCAPIRDQQGNIHGSVLIFRDITEKVKVEAELQKIDRLESLGVLAGGIAHDFNNMLTAVLSCLAQAKIEVARPQRVAEALAEAEAASLQARDLTQQLLTFSKGGAPIKEVTSLATHIENAANFALTGSNVRCEFALARDLWPTEVDVGQVRQAINNVVINGKQAVPGGGTIHVCTENVVVGKDECLLLSEGNYVRVTIEDHGCGIPRKHLSKVFDPFFTTRPKSSGLGLTTALSVIMKHAGYISVESTLGRGTTVSIYLPAACDKRPTEGSESGELETGTGRILLMDDDPIIRKGTAYLLAHVGYEVAVAEEGATAVELYRDALRAGRPFDAVILDLTVQGGMGGLETIETLTGIDPHVKAIVSSGYSNDPVMANHADYGFRGVMAKPYRLKELSRLVRKVVESD